MSIIFWLSIIHLPRILSFTFPNKALLSSSPAINKGGKRYCNLDRIKGDGVTGKFGVIRNSRNYGNLVITSPGTSSFSSYGIRTATSSLFLSKSSVEVVKNRTQDKDSGFESDEEDVDVDVYELRDGNSVNDGDKNKKMSNEGQRLITKTNMETKPPISLSPEQNDLESDNAQKKRKEKGSTSLGSFLLKRKKLEEEKIKEMQDLNIDLDLGDISYNNDNDDSENNDRINIRIDGNDNFDGRGKGATEAENDRNEIMDGFNLPNKANITEVQMEIDQTIKSLASEAEETLVSFIDLTKGKKEKDAEKEKDLMKGLDLETVRDVDQSVSILSTSYQNLMKDIDVLPFSISQSPSVEIPTSEEVDADSSILPLSGATHTARIGRDMRHLAVSIASTIEDAEQWKDFTEDGGGLLPLLECIRDGAEEIDKGPWEKNIYDQGMIGLVEEKEEAFAAAFSACKTLRDLCAISKPFAAIVTDSILRANAAWSTQVKYDDGRIETEGGIISNLVTLLQFSQQADKFYNPRSRRQRMRALRNRGVQRLGNRKQKRGKLTRLYTESHSQLFKILFDAI